MISAVDSCFSSFQPQSHLPGQWHPRFFGEIVSCHWRHSVLPSSSGCKLSPTDSPSWTEWRPRKEGEESYGLAHAFQAQTPFLLASSMCFSEVVWWPCLEYLGFTLLDYLLFWMFPWPCQSPALWKCVNVSHSSCLHSRPGSRLSTWAGFGLPEELIWP